MTIVPASSLSAAEIHMLGTNIVAAVQQDRSELSAVNRSLAIRGEAVDELAAIGPEAGSPAAGATA